MTTEQLFGETRPHLRECSFKCLHTGNLFRVIIAGTAQTCSRELPAGMVERRFKSTFLTPVHATIGSNAFANDNKIMAIDCVTLDVPQLAESAFTSNVYDNCKVNVLGDKIPLFRAATGWRNFKWFLDAGVDDIIADEDAGEPIYFNLRGEPIATPEIPGIYIELRNGKSRKIYVQ